MVFRIFTIIYDKLISMIYSRTEEMANKLRKAFKDRKVKKKYLVITKGIPSLKEGRLTSTFQACAHLMMAVFRWSGILKQH